MAQSQDGGDALEADLARLAEMSAKELRLLWRERRVAAAPALASARLMRLALAWDAQAQALGGETARARKAWARIEAARADGAMSAEALRKAARPAAAEGARLIKTWRGRSHEVLVRADGVEWRGESYRSLSAVARAITGTSRNGPAFFGLRAQGRVGGGGERPA